MSAYKYPPVPEENGVTFLPSHRDTYPFIDPTKFPIHDKRSVFVTGASKGVGRAAAVSYAKAGVAQIAIGARSSLVSLESEMLAAAKAAGRQPPKILALKLDVRSHDSVKDAAKAVEKEFGRLDVLMNNAGYMAAPMLIDESDPLEYIGAWEVNYHGVYYVTKELLPLLLGTADGLKTILNVSSIGAMVLTPGMSSYQASKNAMLRLTELLCVEYASKGLIAFAVHPGGVATELALKMPDYMHAWLTDTPELAGDSLVWLTHERREWLAGRYVSCNWDMEKLLMSKDEIVKGDKLKMKLAV